MIPAQAQHGVSKPRKRVKPAKFTRKTEKTRQKAFAAKAAQIEQLRADYEANKGEPKRPSLRKHVNSDTILNAERMRKAMTPAEQKLWMHISGKQLGCKARRQHVLFGYIADFYFPSRHLIVEVDGGYHQTPDQAEKDARRDANLARHGFVTIRFTNEEIGRELPAVLSSIKQSLAAQPLAKTWSNGLSFNGFKPTGSKRPGPRTGADTAGPLQGSARRQILSPNNVQGRATPAGQSTQDGGALREGCTMLRAAGNADRGAA